MRSLVIGREEKEKIQALIANAESNVFSMDDLLDAHNGEMAPAGDMTNFSCEIPNGYRVVYSIESQPKGLIRHLSVSVTGKGNLPSPIAMEMIMEEFKFKNKISECDIWIEDIDKIIGYSAINIAEQID